MRYLLLVRHSLPQVEPKIPAKLWQLSEEGRLRCHTLAEEAAHYQPQVIVSSPEPKALETASILSSSLHLPLETAVDLHEHEREQNGFLPTEEFEKAIAAFFAHPNKLVFGEETAHHALKRFSDAVEDALASHTGKNVMIVSHGTVITLFVARQERIPPLALWQSLTIPIAFVIALPAYTMTTLIST